VVEVVVDQVDLNQVVKETQVVQVVVEQEVMVVHV
jgi:hypothetical protein